MLAEERFDLILDLMREKRSATVQELCEALNASESTIRRDLTVLDRNGLLHKVHGGATLPQGQFLADEPAMEAKQETAVAEKLAIAQLAAGLIRADDFVFIDAGSSTLQLVKALRGDALQARYVTNGAPHALLLAQKGCKVFLPGGQIRPNTEAIVGVGALQGLQHYHFTKAFMGANGVTVEGGFTTPDVEEALLKAAAVARARQSWFLVDDSKFGRLYAAVICPLADGGILTNCLPDEEYRQATPIKEAQL